eukprot:451697_1
MEIVPDIIVPLLPITESSRGEGIHIGDVHVSKGTTSVLQRQQYVIRRNQQSSYVHLIIPCFGCATGYEETIVSYNLDDYLNTTTDLFRFSWIYHNMVNEYLHKPHFAYVDAIEIWNDSCIIFNTTATNVEEIVHRLQGLKSEGNDLVSDYYYGLSFVIVLIHLIK